MGRYIVASEKVDILLSVLDKCERLVLLNMCLGHEVYAAFIDEMNEQYAAFIDEMNEQHGTYDLCQECLPEHWEHTISGAFVWGSSSSGIIVDWHEWCNKWNQFLRKVGGPYE